MRIHVLPDNVANQIAAGEVIERPAAVVKELLENSLDAGATRVEIAFSGGGKRSIRVEDNGSGMSPDDALLALEPHATSKIQTSSDLNHIATFGFRGEALPSIASVSHFVLKTRPTDLPNGIEIIVNGGRWVHQQACAMPIGTLVEVSHLFSSVPARRKFLKTDATEGGHIVQLARTYAVLYPQVSFLLYEDQNKCFQSPVCSTLKERIYEIFGENIAQSLVQVEYEENGMRLWGLVDKPGILGNLSRRNLLMAVNGRPVENRCLNGALLEGYRGYLPRGRYPHAFLFLEVHPEAVDVNVHPAKREIRFRSEAAIHAFVCKAIGNTLKKFAQPTVGAIREEDPFFINPEALKAFAINSPLTSQIKEEAFEDKKSKGGIHSLAEETKAVLPDLPELGWRFLGMIRDRRGIFETPNGVVILDCRAAHERIQYEHLQHLYVAQETTPSQALLIPLVMPVSPSEANFLQRYEATFERMGILLQPFGRDSFRLEGLPGWLSEDKATPFIQDLLAQAGKISFTEKDLPLEPILKTASQYALQADDVFLPQQCTDLMVRLLRCQVPHTTPRGLPTFFELSFTEIERRLRPRGSNF